MAQQIREIMNPQPTTHTPDTSIADAARSMRDHNVGDVLIAQNGELSGIVTDRDIVVRAVAEDRDLNHTTLGEVCSDELVTLGPDDSVDEAVRLMREGALRRIPVCEEGRAIGIVSIGDLAIERDPESALADISASEPNS